jgi:hypothetical protein
MAVAARPWAGKWIAVVVLQEKIRDYMHYATSMATTKKKLQSRALKNANSPLFMQLIQTKVSWLSIQKIHLQKSI